MSKASIIIPSFNEPYLYRTVRDLLNKAKGNIEILVNIDGNKPKKLVQDKRVRYFHHQVPLGMRGGINVGLKYATGKYIMKVDAHCLFAKNFDEILKKDCKENWLMIPRRYSLHEANWKRGFKTPIKDYHYLYYPNRGRHGYSMAPLEWRKRTYERINKPEYIIDDDMTMQGSCWFAHKKYFLDRVGYLDENFYGTFAADQLEIGLKYWLKDGEIKVNKKTWYAHLHKNRNFYSRKGVQRKYKINRNIYKYYERACKHWVNNQEPGMSHKFQWLVEKFWPVPGWPEDRNLWYIKAPPESNLKPSPSIKETPLCKLAYKYGTDKCPRIKHNFTPYYYSVFKNRRKSVKLLFEMGIGFFKNMQYEDKTYIPRLKRWYHKGASLKMWRDFFPNAQVIGADIQPFTQFEDERIKTYICDETDTQAVRKLLKEFGDRIDIFVDDASHNADIQTSLAKSTLPFLKKDVVYIIEDVTYPNYIIQKLTGYDCEVVECSKRWRDDHLLIIKNS